MRLRGVVATAPVPVDPRISKFAQVKRIHGICEGKLMICTRFVAVSLICWCGPLIYAAYRARGHSVLVLWDVASGTKIRSVLSLQRMHVVLPCPLFPAIRNLRIVMNTDLSEWLLITIPLAVSVMGTCE